MEDMSIVETADLIELEWKGITVCGVINFLCEVYMQSSYVKFVDLPSLTSIITEGDCTDIFRCMGKVVFESI